MNKIITLGNDKKIGSSEKPYFIGEIGINHNGDIRLAKKLIDMASSIGIDSVKFQKRDYLKTIISKQLDIPYLNNNSFGRTYREHKEFLEFSSQELIELSDYTKQKNLDFSCSAFDIESYDFIEYSLNPFFHKIPSPLIVNHELLLHVAKYGKPIFLSTGMSTLNEIEMAVKLIKECNDQLVLFQCTSLYPTENSEVNLKVIKQFIKDYDVLVGFSSHDKSVVFPSVAVGYGACAIEKHITLDRTMKGPDHTSSFEQRGLELAYKYCISTHEALGTFNKTILEREKVSRDKHMQSIVSANFIEAGTKLTETDIVFKAPGTGLMPYEKNKIIGKVATRNIEKDVILTISDFK
jgi:sialic acid synthase